MTLRRAALVFILAFAVVAASLNAGEADIVKYRQSVMKAMGAHMNAMSAIAKGTVPYRGDLAAHASAVKDLAHSLTALFPANTAPDKASTDALPAVWEKPAQFLEAAKHLETEIARMQQLAKTSDAKAIAAQFDATKKACGACHDSFRAQDTN